MKIFSLKKNINHKTPHTRIITISLFTLLTLIPFATKSQNAVEHATGLGALEKYCLEQRAPLIKNTLMNLTGLPALPKTPNIALCLSGGGYRALIVMLAFLCALKTIGLLDACAYVSALSGSTWLLLNWLLRDISLESLTQITRRRLAIPFLATDYFHPEAVTHTLENQCTTEGTFQPASLWGAAVMDHLMGDLPDHGLNKTFEHIRELYMTTNAYPFPLFATVITDVYPYEWLEINPFYTECEYLNARIPTLLFGSEFDDRRLTRQLPEKTCAFHAGIFGSAYCMSAADILNFVTNTILEKTGTTGAIAFFADTVIAPTIERLIQKYSLWEKRILPSRVNNFAHNMEESPYPQTHLTLVDAGYSFLNDPIPPLLKKARHIDVIIIYNATAETDRARWNRRCQGHTTYPEVEAAKEYADQHHRPFPPIDHPQKINTFLSIFRDERHPNVPIVFYFNNPIARTTLKLHYTLEEFDDMFEVIEHIVTESKNPLVQEIRQKTIALNSM
jgi:hypothetical protein